MAAIAGGPHAVILYDEGTVVLNVGHKNDFVSLGQGEKIRTQGCID